MTKGIKKSYKGRRSFASPRFIPPVVKADKSCPNCGEEGDHFVSGGSMFDSFWTCPNLYGEDGRRKPEHMTNPDMGIGALAGLIGLARMSSLVRNNPSFNMTSEEMKRDYAEKHPGRDLHTDMYASREAALHLARTNPFVNHEEPDRSPDPTPHF